jgi:hypothetical protein
MYLSSEKFFRGYTPGPRLNREREKGIERRERKGGEGGEERSGSGEGTGGEGRSLAGC